MIRTTSLGLRHTQNLAFVCGLCLLSACDQGSGDADGGDMDGGATDAALRDAMVDGESTDSGSGPGDSGSGDSGSGDGGSDGGLNAPGFSSAADLRAQVIYLVMTDRFANGDTGNDLAGTAECLDAEHPGRFHGGDFAGLEQRLGYVQELGGTSLWLTPINVQSRVHNDACGYHGYWADLEEAESGALEPKLGDEDDFNSLLRASHERDLRVLLDVVVNHSGRGATLVTERPQWFHSPADCEASANRTQDCSLNGLPDFRHERADVVDYLNNQTQTLLNRFDIDGLRIDTVKHVPATYFRDHYFPIVRAVDGHRFVVGEILDFNFDRFDGYLDTGFDSLFNFPVQRALTQVFVHGQSVDLLAARVRETLDHFGTDGATILTNLIDNHDLDRMAQVMDRSDPVRAEERYRSAMTALFTLPGIPQLYYGNELGMLGGHNNHDNRRDMPEWAFSAETREGMHAGYLGDSGRIFDHVQTLARLRAEHVALREGELIELWTQNGADNANVYVFLRRSGDDRVIVMINAGDDSREVRPRIQTSGTLSDADKLALSDGTPLQILAGQVDAGREPHLQEGRLSVHLPPRSTLIVRPNPSAP